MRHTEKPDDAPEALVAILRALTTPPHGVSQREAARMLRIDDTTIRRWLSPPTASQHRAPPWAAVELLRRLVQERQRQEVKP